MSTTNDLYLEIEGYFDGEIPWPVQDLISDHKKLAWVRAEHKAPDLATVAIVLASGQTTGDAKLAFYSKNNRGEPGWFDTAYWKPLDKEPVFYLPIPRPPPELL